MLKLIYKRTYLGMQALINDYAKKCERLTSQLYDKETDIMILKQTIYFKNKNLEVRLDICERQALEIKALNLEIMKLKQQNNELRLKVVDSVSEVKIQETEKAIKLIETCTQQEGKK